jgi:NCS1 family nucleobase:cation symporter-1
MNRQALRERGNAALRKTQLRLTKPSSWKLPKQSSSIAPPHVWTNADMDPVPVEKRTWGNGAFVSYWVSDLVTISTWSSGSAIITLGMSSQERLLRKVY